MKKKILVFLILIISLLIFAGCTSQHNSKTISTKSITGLYANEVAQTSSTTTFQLLIPTTKSSSNNSSYKVMITSDSGNGLTSYSSNIPENITFRNGKCIVQIDNLKPEDSYIFIIAIENSKGFILKSVITKKITIAYPIHPTLEIQNIISTQKSLQFKIIPYDIKLVKNSQYYIEYYGENSQSQQIQSTSNIIKLTNLDPGACYTITVGVLNNPKIVPFTTVIATNPTKITQETININIKGLKLTTQGQITLTQNGIIAYSFPVKSASYTIVNNNYIINFPNEFKKITIKPALSISRQLLSTIDINKKIDPNNGNDVHFGQLTIQALVNSNTKPLSLTLNFSKVDSNFCTISQANTDITDVTSSTMEIFLPARNFAKSTPTLTLYSNNKKIFTKTYPNRQIYIDTGLNPNTKYTLLFTSYSTPTIKTNPKFYAGVFTITTLKSAVSKLPIPKLTVTSSATKNSITLNWHILNLPVSPMSHGYVYHTNIKINGKTYMDWIPKLKNKNGKINPTIHVNKNGSWNFNQSETFGAPTINLSPNKTYSIVLQLVCRNKIGKYDQFNNGANYLIKKINVRTSGGNGHSTNKFGLIFAKEITATHNSVTVKWTSIRIPQGTKYKINIVNKSNQQFVAPLYTTNSYIKIPNIIIKSGENLSCTVSTVNLKNNVTSSKFVLGTLPIIYVGTGTYKKFQLWLGHYYTNSVSRPKYNNGSPFNIAACLKAHNFNIPDTALALAQGYSTFLIMTNSNNTPSGSLYNQLISKYNYTPTEANQVILGMGPDQFLATSIQETGLGLVNEFGGGVSTPNTFITYHDGFYQINEELPWMISGLTGAYKSGGVPSFAYNYFKDNFSGATKSCFSFEGTNGTDSLANISTFYRSSVMKGYFNALQYYTLTSKRGIVGMNPFWKAVSEYYQNPQNSLPTPSIYAASGTPTSYSLPSYLFFMRIMSYVYNRGPYGMTGGFFTETLNSNGNIPIYKMLGVTNNDALPGYGGRYIFQIPIVFRTLEKEGYTNGFYSKIITKENIINYFTKLEKTNLKNGMYSETAINSTINSEIFKNFTPAPYNSTEFFNEFYPIVHKLINESVTYPLMSN